MSQKTYELVESTKEAMDIVKSVLLEQKIIAIDCEGVLLSKTGKLTVLQIGLVSGKVYIFDILKGGTLMFLGISDDQPGLKKVLESKHIIKILHDCRSDWDSLLYQYSVRLCSFIDTQEAYFIYALFYNQEVALPVSLFNFIKFCNGNSLTKKIEVKNIMSDDIDLWKKRPIEENLLAYAAEDVIYLISAWFKLKNRLWENLIDTVKVLSAFKVIDNDLFSQFYEFIVSSYFESYQKYGNGEATFMHSAKKDYLHKFCKKKNFTLDTIESAIHTDDFKKKQKLNFLSEIISEHNPKKHYNRADSLVSFRKIGSTIESTKGEVQFGFEGSNSILSQMTGCQYDKENIQYSNKNGNMISNYDSDSDSDEDMGQQYQFEVENYIDSSSMSGYKKRGKKRKRFYNRRFRGYPSDYHSPLSQKQGSYSDNTKYYDNGYKYHSYNGAKRSWKRYLCTGKENESVVISKFTDNEEAI